MNPRYWVDIAPIYGTLRTLSKPKTVTANLGLIMLPRKKINFLLVSLDASLLICRV